MGSYRAGLTRDFGFEPGRPPRWDLERFLRGDGIDTAVITLERNRRTFAWKCAGVGADDGPDELRALWTRTVHRSRESLDEALARGGLEQTTSDGMSLRTRPLRQPPARGRPKADAIEVAVAARPSGGAPSTSL
ncbi:hypothetical protein [Terrabacter aeriphilus]|uniref:hypothetical protein n=1 Tax=Terrabacter aeriphilus TaxID=515662 RepID=UPI0031E9B6B3